MIMISLPVLMGGNGQSANAITASSSAQAIAQHDDGISDRTQYLTTARNLLISGADAIERLMSSYKEIVALAGYTYRVAGMLEVFDDTAHGRYHKLMMAEGRNNAGILEFRNGQPITKGRIIVSSDPNDRSISLVNVPVVTPNCDIVIPSLTLRIEPGMHLLITGPNGCGKSSLFRIINGLWPIYGGELHIPKPIVSKPSMFYIPQRPYLTIGNLRDQIIYPDTVDDMLSKKYTEEMLHEIMKTVSLEHIVARYAFECRKRDTHTNLKKNQKSLSWPTFIHSFVIVSLICSTETVSMLYEIGKIYYPGARNNEWLLLVYFTTGKWAQA